MLRHSLGLLAGIVLTPLLWVGAAWSTAEIVGHVQAQRFGDPLLTACAAMIGVGLVGGVLAATRVSPLAAFVSGGVLLGVPLWALLDPASMDATVPGWLVDPESFLRPLGPGLPLFLALGTLLFISSLVLSRWRPPRRDRTEEAYPPAAEHAPSRRRAPEPASPPPAGRPVAPDAGWVDDPSAKTTTPFRRGEDGVRPLGREDDDRTRLLGDGR
ncbi:hypothetical protein NI17_015605 [Thermobifida halotolerans]|uniref:Uncharacterized protein n=1 Tax=Thermobifida halotolerans TaxID=483545 RepID=A0A399G2V2_9ACTN|nr:hypothetical protein [Thermobifida halotolerans]UOE18260.1 hypothetical protein NI17_015605 [Thermobifida halotolerans]